MSEVRSCCEDCFNSVLYPQNSVHKPHKYVIARGGALTYALNILEEDGACLAKCVMDKYKELLITNYEMQDIANSEYINYKKILKINIDAKGFMCYCPSKKNPVLCTTQW